MKFRSMKTLILLALAIALTGHAGTALADVAANAPIVNQASLTFDDGTGSQTINVSVVVKVSLVKGAASVSCATPATLAYNLADTAYTYTYYVTAGGNGPDTYSLASSVAGQNNTIAPGAPAVAIAAPDAPNSVALGATITAQGSAAGSSVLTVPQDGLSDGELNGIDAGDWVVINGGTLAQVLGITDPDDDTSLATITLTAPLAAAVPAGIPVLERKEFTVTVYSGTIQTVGTDIEVFTETSAANSDSTASNVCTVTTTYTSGKAALTKYVRNVSDNGANPVAGGTPFTINLTNADYFTAGVEGKATDVLEYLLVVENQGTGDLTAASINDVLPTDFVTFDSATYDVIYVDEDGGEHSLTQGGGDDRATLTGGAALEVHVGGTNPAQTTAGVIPFGKTVMVTYRVTIK